MADYLEEIVQNIKTKCDLSGFEELSIAILDATKKAQGLASQLNNTLTGTQKTRIAEVNAQARIAEAKAKEVASWNAVQQQREITLRAQELTQRKELDAEISHNNNLREQEKAKIAHSNEITSHNNNLKAQELTKRKELDVAISQNNILKAQELKQKEQEKAKIAQTNEAIKRKRKKYKFRK